MSRKRTGCSRKQPIDRHGSSREALEERTCRAIAEGLSLHAAATRESVMVETLKRWLAEDEAFRARYEKARAIGRTFVLDDVLALADSLPGTGRADIRLKLAARKWWVTTIARDAAARKKGVAERRYEAELRAEAEAETQAEAKRAQNAAEMMRYKMREQVQFLKSERWTRAEILRDLDRKWPGVPLPPFVADELPRVVNRRPSAGQAPARKPAPKAAGAPIPESAAASPAPEPAALSPAPEPSAAPLLAPASTPRSIYDLSAWPPPPVEHKTMKDWDPFSW